MDFLKMVQTGVEKSNQSRIAMAEVDAVFTKVNEDLKRFSLGELRLVRSISTMGRVSMFTNAMTGIDSPHLAHDKITLYLQTEDGEFWEEVAGWKQRAAGYPCVIKFDGQELSCSGEKNLINGISELLASVGFGNAVNKLVKSASDAKAKRERAKSTNPTGKQVSEGQGAVASKNDAAPTAPPAVKAPAKPRAAKPAAKPANNGETQRTGAIKPAVKPAVKPATTKPTLKSPPSFTAPQKEKGASGRRSSSRQIEP